ncbi:MAG: phosphoribosyl-ATP diphosphatase [Gammaproteobacteria bacterium]|jgi:phosphoribosyl-ATP pyrophosphohydrolase
MGETENLVFLIHLESVIRERLQTQDPNSYTAKLVAGGKSRVAQKVAEEAVETALASATDAGRDAVISESADLLYHLFVLLAVEGVDLADVAAELGARHRSLTA